jgi:probable HAF family extracellular repeat protein
LFLGKLLNGSRDNGGFSEALNVNKRGQIVGSGTTATGEEHAILWNNGEVIDLGTLGGRFSRAWVSTTVAGSSARAKRRPVKTTPFCGRTAR